MRVCTYFNGSSPVLLHVPVYDNYFRNFYGQLTSDLIERKLNKNVTDLVDIGTNQDKIRFANYQGQSWSDVTPGHMTRNYYREFTRTNRRERQWLAIGRFD